MRTIGDGKRMESRKPDIYEKVELENGRTIAMSIWVSEKTVNIRVSEKVNGKWNQLLSKNLWKCGLR